MRPRRRSPISRGMTNPHAQSAAPWHGTTILSARSEDKVVIIGDGQVSMGQTVMKPNARKVRRLHDGSVIGGFAGRSEEHTSELQSLMRISYAVFCFNKKKMKHTKH